jgi:arsenate reductase
VLRQAGGLSAMAERVYNVLFLCTHNSARSVLAETLLNALGGGRFRGYSAGSFPSGRVNPLALETLAGFSHPTDGLRSKSWDEFARPGAPVMDFVITVCDQAAGEVCPIWPGQPITAHWGLPDPSQAPGTDDDRRTAFKRTYMALLNRLRLFTSLPFDKLDLLALKQRLTDIGQPVETVR